MAASARRRSAASNSSGFAALTHDPNLLWRSPTFKTRTITGLVDALAAGGLATRKPHPSDRRATLVTLTADGQRLTAKLKRDYRTLARALFAQMSRRELASFERGWPM